METQCFHSNSVVTIETTNQEVWEEEEAEPVGEHFLCHSLSSSQEKFWVRLENGLMHHVFEQSLENSTRWEEGGKPLPRLL